MQRPKCSKTRVWMRSQENLLIPSPNIKPPNSRYSHYVVYCNILGVFVLGEGAGSLILGEGMTSLPTLGFL